MRYSSMSFDDRETISGIEPQSLTEVAAVPTTSGSLADLGAGKVAIDEGLARFAAWFLPRAERARAS